MIFHKPGKRPAFWLVALMFMAILFMVTLIPSHASGTLLQTRSGQLVNMAGVPQSLDFSTGRVSSEPTHLPTLGDFIFTPAFTEPWGTLPGYFVLRPGVFIVDLGFQNIDTLTHVPTTGYGNGRPWLPGHSYALMLPDRTYVAFQIVSFTTGPNSATLNFRYKYQPDGTPILRSVVSRSYSVPAWIKGVVVDGTGAKKASAIVCLNSCDQLTFTDSLGFFSFSNLSAGKYSVWSPSADGEDKKTVTLNSKSLSASVRLTVPGSPCNPGITPVLLVPGIMGSTTESGRIPTLPKNPPEWDDTSWKQVYGIYDYKKEFGWQNLITALTDAGYKLGCTLFPVPYDWRMSLSTNDSPNSVDSYLLPQIDHAKAKSGMQKVDIIAHSMGGLLVRSHIQSSAYTDRQDVDRFAMVGTPNKGATAAYFLWEGGDPEYADSVNGFIPAYTASVAQLYSTYKWFSSFTSFAPIRARQYYDLVHDHVPSVRQLMPTYSFLSPRGTLQCERNDFLEALNSAESREVMVEGSAPGKIETKVFAGIDHSTPNSVSTNLILGCSSKLYKDGIPVSVDKSHGDGTVLKDSARVSWVGYAEKSGEHPYLVNIFKDDLMTFITGGIRNSNSLKTPLATQEDSATTLVLSLTGGATPYLVDSLDRGCGINPTTDAIEDTCPGSSILIGSDMAEVIVPNPENGTYTLSLKDSYSRQYRLLLTYSYQTGTEEKEFWGFNNGESVSVTFNLDASNSNHITITQTPSPPGSLKARPVPAENGTNTLLTWEASTDSNVLFYNVYVKAASDEAFIYLDQAGGTSYDAGATWAEGLSDTTKTYAVTAVGSDGIESFLSNQVIASYLVTEIPLYQGWNFISSGMLPKDSSIPLVFADVSQNVQIMWGYDNETKQWRKYKPDIQNSPLNTFEPDKGYWIYVNDAAYLALSGTSATSSVQLHEGWNLVGYNGQNSQAIDTGLSSIGDIWSIIWSWSNGQWCGKHIAIADLPSPIQPLSILKQGNAYWIKIKQAAGPTYWNQ